jgi:Ca-activated chloride channel family protein
MKIAQADVIYENPFTRKQEQSSGDSWASFSMDPKKVEASTNVSVVKEYQLNLNALAQEKAIALSDKGKKKEAVQELKKSAAMLKMFGSQYKDREILKEADALEIQAETIEDQGMTQKSRKLLRTQSYQQKVQQKTQE